MKKVILSSTAIALLFMTACGETAETKTATKEKSLDEKICECFEGGMAMQADMKEAGGDADKMEAVRVNYKDQMESCDKIGNEIQNSMKDMTDEEQEARQTEMMNACPAMKEMMGG